MPDMTLDEIGKEIEASKKPATPKAAELKLDSEDLPEHLRGKSAAEIATMVEGLQMSLRTSEEARRQAMALAETASRSPAPAPEPKREEPPFKVLSQDELKQLMIDDPIAATEYITAKSTYEVTRNFEQRFGSLQSSTAATQRREAESRFKEEFTVLGKEIDEFVNSLPDKTVLSAPQAWDDLVSYVAGKNRAKLRDYYVQNHKPAPTLEGSREEERSFAPGHVPRINGGDFSRTSTYSGKLTPDKMDETMKEIAKNLGQTPEEYCQFFNAGAQ